MNHEATGKRELIYKEIYYERSFDTWIGRPSLQFYEELFSISSGQRMLVARGESATTAYDFTF